MNCKYGEGYDAFGNHLPILSVRLDTALDKWAGKQPPGYEITPRDLAATMQGITRTRYPGRMGPITCARKLLQVPGWVRDGQVLRKGQALPPVEERIRLWLHTGGIHERAHAVEYAHLYSEYAALQEWPPISARGIVEHLVINGYVRTARTNAGVIYARPDCWI